MTNQNMKSFIEQLAVEAGRITLRFFRNSVKTEFKPNNLGVVSQGDLETEAFIVKQITEKYPTHKILAEEGSPEFLQRLDDEYLWFIDPIDGTTNFVQGNVYYCVSIGLYKIKNSLALPVMAVVHQPASGDLYFAEKGKGAYLNGKRLSLLDSPVPQKGSYGTGFSYNTKDHLTLVLNAITAVKKLDPAITVRINGAAALDICRTAQSVLSGFWEYNLSPWDMAAGSLVVQEAGGLATNFKGEEYNPLRDKNIICGPPAAHKLLLDSVGPIFS